MSFAVIVVGGGGGDVMVHFVVPFKMCDANEWERNEAAHEFVRQSLKMPLIGFDQYNLIIHSSRIFHPH